VIVSKKISAKAVERNRVRRKINEIVRKNWLDIPVGYNILVIAKKTSLGIENKKLEMDILSTLKRALSK
jgi:ribonuclease P protein component